MSKKDYYEVLGISKGSSDSDIKKAYRKQSKKHVRISFTSLLYILYIK